MRGGTGDRTPLVRAFDEYLAQGIDLRPNLRRDQSRRPGTTRGLVAIGVELAKAAQHVVVGLADEDPHSLRLAAGKNENARTGLGKRGDRRTVQRRTASDHYPLQGRHRDATPSPVRFVKLQHAA